MRRLLLCLALLANAGCTVAVVTTPAKALAKVYDREDFKKLVLGKSKEEVLDLLGKPEKTRPGITSEHWHYHKRTQDAVSGKVDGLTILLIRDDKVRDIRY